MHLYRKIISIREIRGIKQYKLASKAGVRQKKISKTKQSEEAEDYTFIFSNLF